MKTLAAIIIAASFAGCATVTPGQRAVARAVGRLALDVGKAYLISRVSGYAK